MNQSPHHWKDARRLQAWELLQHGWSQRQIAEAMGVSEAAVSPWMKCARAQGPAALQPRSPPGVPRRLAAGQLASLPGLLHRGAEAYGFRGQVWTRARVAFVIPLACGVWYHPAHVSRLLKAIQWSLHKPARRARPCDEAAMARRHQETWPAIQKVPRRISTPSSS
jgi:transposase